MWCAIVMHSPGVGPQMAGPTFGLPPSGGVLDTLTGGEYSQVMGQLNRLETLLKVSIVASFVAGAAGLASLLRR